MITASRRARATMAFCRPRRRATVMAQAFSQDHFCTRVSSTWAAHRAALIMASPHSESANPIALAGLIENRREPQSGADGLGSLEPRRNVDRGAKGQRHHGPTPGMVIRRRQTSSSRTIANTLRCRMAKRSRRL